MGRFSAGILLVALAATAALAPGTNAESAGAWTEVLHLDCKGNMNFMNNHLLAAQGSFTDVIDIAQYVSDRLFERAKGACPALSLNEFARDFVPSPSAFVNFLMGRRGRTDSTCSKDTFTMKFAEYIRAERDLQLPNTCSLDTLAAGKGCLMKIPLSDERNSFLNFAIDTCDAKLMKPFMSVTCSGPLCSRLAMPCGADSECGGNLKCTALSGTTVREADEEARDMLTSMEMLNDGPSWAGGDGGQCFSPKKGGDIVGSFMNFFRGFYDGKPWSWKPWNYDMGSWTSGGEESKLNFCGGNILDSSFTEKWVDPVGCESDDSLYVCNGLQPWDGVLSDGTNVLAAPRKQGEIFNNPSGTGGSSSCAADKKGLRALMDVSCWGKIGINLGKRMTAHLSMRHLPALMEWYASTMKQVQDCRGDGSAYSMAYYTANFIPWMPTGFMQRFTVSSTEKPGAVVLPAEKPAVTNKMGDMMDSMQDDVAGRLKMPDTCSLETWLRTGNCVMEYSGLSSLIGSQLTLRMRMETCPLNKHMPRIQLDCEGAACAMMTPATTCQRDTDCDSVGSNMECTDFTDEISDDPIGALLWPKISGQYAYDYSTFSYIWSKECNNYPEDKGRFSKCSRERAPFTRTCGDSMHCSSSKFISELGNFITNHVDGKPYAENSNSKFCTPRLKKISDDVNDWSKGQYTTSGDIYTVAGMRDANAVNIAFCAATAYPAATVDPSVKTVFKVQSAAVLTGYTVETFGDNQKQSFREGVAMTLGANPDSVRITGVKASASGRHLLAAAGVEVSFEVQYADEQQAEAVKEKVVALKANPAKMEDALKASGLDKLETLSVAEPTVTSGERFAAPAPADADAPPTKALPSPPPIPPVMKEEVTGAASTTHSLFVVAAAAATALSFLLM